MGIFWDDWLLLLAAELGGIAATTDAGKNGVPTRTFSVRTF